MLAFEWDPACTGITISSSSVDIDIETYKGKTISTPTPAIILRIRKVVWDPALRRAITIPLSTDTLRLFSGTS